MTSPVQVAFVQGVQTPDTIVHPALFYKLTRRMRFAAQSPTAIASGSSSQVQLKKTGVVSGLEIRVAGSVVIGGTIGTTTASWEWPLNLLKGVKLSVNGQSTLIDARGIDIKVAEFMGDRGLDDRGVSQRVGNATAKTQGTLSLSHEDWGGTGAAANFIAPGLNVAAIATYPIELTFFLPVAADQASLVGSVFGQSQATNINIELIWGSQSDLFSAVGGAATISFTGVTYDVTAVAYSIPVVDGKAVLPDLSNLHGLNHVQMPITASGETEFMLAGTGAGRYLLRAFYNVYSSSVPLAATFTNFANQSYKFGANDVPEIFPNGSKLRAKNERDYNTDIGAWWGFMCHDFENAYALRDIIDLGTTADFRVVVGLTTTPTAGQVHLSQETLFLATVGA
jgi:hypothetical protein